ncbi:unnamed protein product [Orchesella dallaii]|uniref:Uncharacterized protein n=1 Tax=Orchesella dallaii TaxID=48710 RepID=A0ABP1PTY5_9HEXA
MDTTGSTKNSNRSGKSKGIKMEQTKTAIPSGSTSFNASSQSSLPGPDGVSRPARLDWAVMQATGHPKKPNDPELCRRLQEVFGDKTASAASTKGYKKTGDGKKLGNK